MRRLAAITLLAVCPLYRVAAQDQPSARAIMERVAPSYPDLARRLNMEGVVKLRVTVEPGGSVQSIDVVGGNPVLAKAAQDAVVHWKWVPGPKETKEIVEIRFHPK